MDAMRGTPPAGFSAHETRSVVFRNDVHVLDADGEKVAPHWHPTDEHYEFLTHSQDERALQNGHGALMRSLMDPVWTVAFDHGNLRARLVGLAVAQHKLHLTITAEVGRNSERYLKETLKLAHTFDYEPDSFASEWEIRTGLQ